MKTNKINYLAVGLFMILTIGGMIFSIALLAGRTGATDSYHAVYNNVTGVKFGSQVLYEGFPVGQVEEVTPVEVKGRMRFRVDFSVSEGWRIPSDSVAQIASAGLLSAITISIQAGLSEKPLAPGSEIQGLESADLLAAVSNVASEISLLTETSVKPLLKNITEAVDLMHKMVADDGVEISQNVRTVVAEISKRAPAIIGNIDKFSGNFSQLSTDLRATRETLDQLLVSMNTLVIDNKASVEESIQDLRYVVDSFARHVDSVNQNMEGTARNMYEFSRQIRQNPGLLLGGTPPVDRAKSGNK